MSATTESNRVRDESELSHRCRARAIAYAVRGELTPAFEQLEWSWELGGASTAEAGTDVAWIHLLAGNPDSALALLSVVTRRRRRMTRRVRALLVACVSLDRALWIRALTVCLTRGSTLDRARGAAAVVGARLGLSAGRAL